MLTFIIENKENIGINQQIDKYIKSKANLYSKDVSTFKFLLNDFNVFHEREINLRNSYHHNNVAKRNNIR